MAIREIQPRVDEYKCDGCGAIATHTLPKHWGFANCGGIYGSYDTPEAAEAYRVAQRPFHWCSPRCLVKSGFTEHVLLRAWPFSFSVMIQFNAPREPQT